MKQYQKFLLLLAIGVTTIFSSCSSNRPRSSGKVYMKFMEKGQDIQFTSDGYLLKGKVVTNAPAGRKVPLIVFCVGSGLSSYQTNYARFIDTIFLQTLPMDSLAVLYFDKRGVGGSEGEWSKTDFERRAADAKAAAEFAKTLSFVDASRIFVAGHSQGGWITEIALANYPETFAGGISMAGAAYPVREQLVNDYTSRYICKKQLPEEKAVKKARRSVSGILTVATLFPYNDVLKQLKLIRNFAPAYYLSKIRQPFVFFFGDNDALVHPEWNKKALTAVFQKGVPANFDIVTIKGANHNFGVSDLCYEGASSKLTYSPEFRAALLQWVRTHVLH